MEAIYAVALEVATTLTIHRPNVNDVIKYNDTPVDLSPELRLLQASSISLLCLLYADGVRASNSFNGVTTVVVENLFGSLQNQEVRMYSVKNM